jgi:Tfp pilus assembly protein PilN
MKAVNLLPSDLRGAPKASAAITARQDVPRGPGAFIVLGALAFGVLALAGYVLTSNTIKDRQSELVQLESQYQVAQQRAAALAPYAQFDQLAKGRVATLRDLAGRRFDWDQALRDLSRSLPGDVTLKSLDGSVSSANGGGGGLRSSIDTPAITLQGCTSSHSAVARLMSRLRTVNGVTRVSLSRSVKPGTAAAATGTPGAAAGAASSTRPPCGDGRRPEFEVVIFFEGAKDKASDPAASATTPATPPASGQAAGAQSSTGTQPATGQPATGQPASGQAAGGQAASGGTQASTTASTQGGAQ